MYSRLSHTRFRSVRRICAKRSRWAVHEIAVTRKLIERDERGSDLTERLGESLTSRQLRHVDLENEQRDDDREHTVGQRHEPCRVVAALELPSLPFLDPCHASSCLAGV